MDHAYCIIVVGSGGVGKSCLTIQYVAQRFVENYDPTLEDSFRKTATVNGTDCVLHIIDTAGQDEFLAVRESYYTDGDGFVCVYDVTNKNTFQEVKEFHNSILRVKDTNYVPFILVGNKCDLEERREILQWEGKDLAERIGCHFIETSAKAGQRVGELFTQLVAEIMSARTQSSAPNAQSGVTLRWNVLVAYEGE